MINLIAATKGEILILAFQIVIRICYFWLTALVYANLRFDFGGALRFEIEFTPESVSRIDQSVFYGCTGLTNIEIPDSVTEIADFAFCDCTGLKSVKVPAGVAKVGRGAFEGCTGLQRIIIPASLLESMESAVGVCYNREMIEVYEDTDSGRCLFSLSEIRKMGQSK